LYCAGGAESMSFIPMGGYKPTPDYAVAKAGNEDYYWEILHICWLKLR
jgi:acetyl-CoA acyltransferase